MNEEIEALVGELSTLILLKGFMSDVAVYHCDYAFGLRLFRLFDVPTPPCA